MWQIWCEWDIGHNDLVFITEAKARNWAYDRFKELSDDFDAPSQQYESDGLLGYRKLTVI